MIELPHVFVVRGSVDERRAPVWPPRDCRRSGSPRTRHALEADLSAMVRVIRHADLVAGSTHESVFALWQRLQSSRSGPAGRSPPLLAHLGTSLVERAAIRCLLPRKARPPSRARFTRTHWASSWARSIQRWGEPARRLAARAAPLGRRASHRRLGRSLDARPDSVEERVADRLPHALADAVHLTRHT